MNLDRIIAVRTTKTVYRDGDRVIKLFNEDYSASDVLNEALNQARVEETGARIPKLHEVTKVDGKWAIISEFIEGKTLAHLMAENPDKSEEHLGLFVAAQLGMHKLSAPLLNDMKEKLHRKIRGSGLDATSRYTLHTRLDALPNHKKLCHGDYNPENVVISDKDSSVYLLDWAHATQGSASGDAATTYMLFWLSGEIRNAERYLELFCEKSDTAKQYVQKWISIVAAAQLAKGNPAEREFLLHWTNVADYE